MRSSMISLALLASLAGIAGAQGTAADYERAEKLGQRFGGKVTHAKVDAHWSADDSAFWFRSDTGPGTWEFVRIETGAGERRPAFDHRALAAALAKTGGKFAEDHLALDNLDLSAD